MKTLIILLSCCTLCSCATLISLEDERLIHRDLQHIEIHTLPDSSTICLPNDSCIKAPVVLEVPRKGNDLKLLITSDSLEKAITLKTKSYKTCDFGRLYFVSNHPSKSETGNSQSRLILDYDNPILIDLTDQSHDYKSWRSSAQGQLYFRASFPWVDYIGFDNGPGFENYMTYVGMTIGADYYHSGRSYVSLTVGATGLSEFAFPGMEVRYDTAEFLKTYCIKLGNNHDFNLFSNANIVFTVGYGFNLTHFRYIDNDYVYHVTIHKNTKSVLGLNFSANLLIFKYGFVGLNYLPSFYTLISNHWEYSFLAYIDFGIRIPFGHYRKIPYPVLKIEP
jgi:hypothetical protein